VNARVMRFLVRAGYVFVWPTLQVELCSERGPDAAVDHERHTGRNVRAS